MTGTAGRTDPDHVIYVSTDPGVPVFGRKGCSVHVQAVLREMLRRGARVDLVTCRPGGDPPPGLKGVHVHDLGRPSSQDPGERERRQVEQDGRAAALVDALLQARAEARRPLVYQRYALFSCEVMEVAARLDVPGVLEVNAPLIDEQARHRVLVDAEAATARTRRALLGARLAYAVSGPVARWTEQLLDGARAVPVVANGVDVDRFPVRARGPQDAAPLTVGFVGTFRPWHGVDLLVEAAGRLQSTGAVRLLLVGDGPQRQAVLAEAARRGVQVDAPGAVDPGRVPALLAGADIAAAPYPAGARYFSPLKVMEYLAAGLPTVAAALADLPMLVRGGEELLLVPPGDLDALTDALRRLRDDPQLRHRLGRAGRAAASERLTWCAVTDRILELAEAAQPPRQPVASAPAGRSA